MLALELVGKVLNKSVVKIFTSEMRISGRGLDLEDTVIDSEKGDIERAATEVEYENIFLSLSL